MAAWVKTTCRRQRRPNFIDKHILDPCSRLVFQVNIDGMRHGVSSKRDGGMLYVLRHEAESERRSNNPAC
jgi:hypothetical protein